MKYNDTVEDEFFEMVWLHIKKDIEDYAFGVSPGAYEMKRITRKGNVRALDKGEAYARLKLMICHRFLDECHEYTRLNYFIRSQNKFEEVPK